MKKGLTTNRGRKKGIYMHGDSFSSKNAIMVSLESNRNQTNTITS